MLKKFLKIKDKKLIFLRISILAIPSYAVALLTEKIIYVVPTIAMMLMISNSVETGNSSNRNRIEDDNNIDSEGDADGIGESEGGIGESEGGI